MEKQDNIIKVNRRQLLHEIGFFFTAFNSELHNSDEDVTGVLMKKMLQGCCKSLA